MKHPDFDKKHFPFTAALLRDGEDKKLVSSCTTIDGYLCKLSSEKKKGIWINSFAPLWNARLVTDELKAEISQIKNMQTAISKYPELLLKFGKQEGYWIWNVEAAEKKKLEETKTVYTFSKKTDEYDDEGELCISKKNYPHNILTVIKANCHDDTRHFIVSNSSKLANGLKVLGWTLVIKS
jgi:hypothetical protein